MTDFVNRALFGVASAPGTGNIAVGAAVSGPYRTLGAAQDGMTFDVAITDGSAWEVRTGCVYTHGTTTLTRGTLEDSSTGSAISLSASAQVMVTSVSSRESFVERLMRGTQPGGRLTLTSGVPVTTSDVTGATTVYYTPYVHDTIVLWDGVRWRPVIFAEISHALGTMTANTNYDVFGYLNAGTLALEKTAWTNDTTRATAVTIQDGRYCKSGDKTRLLLGTIRSTSTTATEDSKAKRLVSNLYNKIQKVGFVLDGTDHSYSSSTPRRWNNNAANQIEFVTSLGCGAQATVYSSANVNALAGIFELDTSSGTPIVNAGIFLTGAGGATSAATYGFVATPGRHFVAVSEYSVSASAVDFFDMTLTLGLEQ